MNPNSQQAVQDQESGEEEEIQDIDYDALYGVIDIDTTSPEKTPEMKRDYLKLFGDTAKDVVKQGVKETLIGAAGTWGDLAELAGLRGSPDKDRFQEFESLERLEQPGQSSLSDIEGLSEDSMVPESFRLPRTQDLRNVNEAIGGPGEAETSLGKAAGRAGGLFGAGLAFGGVNPVASLAAGAAGQATEELGGGPLAQAASEIATLLLTQGRGGSKTLVSSTKKDVTNKINELRKLGYTEEQITLAINSASKGQKGGIQASKGIKTAQAFEDFSEKSNQLVSDILTAEIPGIDRGIRNVHELASDAYGEVARQASNIVIKDSSPFINSATEVVRELRKNLGRNPEGEAFLGRLAEAVMDSTRSPTAENFMNFYKELNKAGNWMGRNQKDRLITQVKNGIKETFRSEGKAGRKLADDFEKANAGIRKAYQAEEVHDLIQKTATQDGIDFKKLNKVFDKPDNVHLMQDVLGNQQTKNLNTIAKTGKEIKDFDKAWKATNLLQGSNVLNLASGGSAAYFLYKGDMKGLAASLAVKGSGAAAKKLAEKLLTDPKFQNLTIKGLHAIKNESPRLYVSANAAMQKYLDDEGIDIDLD